MQPPSLRQMPSVRKKSVNSPIRIFGGCSTELAS
jgi:hypothetical protein